MDTRIQIFCLKIWCKFYQLCIEIFYNFEKNTPMKKILLFLILICFCELIFSQPGIDKNWSTTTNSSYSDDFNSPSLNLTKWKVWNQDWDLGNPNPNLHVWKEFCFTNDKARLTTLGSKSVLELSALKDSRCTTLFGNGSSLKKISSGAIEYANIANYPKYGYFEASCMFNVVGDSYMPAFWLWDSNSSNNPNDCWYNEIDIEIWSHLKPSMPFNYTHTVHYKDPSLQNNCAFAAPSTEIFTPANTLNDGNFHKYGIEWTPERVIWYYDDSPIRMKTFNIPSHPMRILFDLGFIIQQFHITHLVIPII